MRPTWLALLISICTVSSTSAATLVQANTASAASNAQIVHALNRLTFGPAPGDIDYVRRIGLTRYIEEQLNPQSIAENPEVLQAERSLPSASETAGDLIAQFRDLQKQRREALKEAKNADADPQTLKKIDNPIRQANMDYMNVRLMQDIESPRQLEAVMSEFWFNHFNVYVGKGLDRALAGPYMEQAIRPYALGNFRDLVAATCFHPAMLFYLDNWQNAAPGTQGAGGKEVGINENYARELMELHTLGVDGGYTQKDVQELARILTGLGLGPAHPNQRVQRFLQPVGPFGAYFIARRHDFGDKTLIGYHIKGSGEQEIEQALDILCSSPATAHHISYQLAQYFVADDPPKALVDRMTKKFMDTKGNIKSVLREMFSSPEFWSPQYTNTKYKSPLRYTISSLRASGIHSDNYLPLTQFLKLQGEPLYGCLTPDGYKNTKAAWLNPDALLARINYATALSAGRIKKLSAEPVNYELIASTLSGELSPKTASAISKAPEQLKAALLLGSPEFMQY